MNKFKLALAGLVAGAAMISAPAAQAESDFSFSGNVAFTNDYVYRGFTQSNEDFAVQGGFDIEHSSGFYIGTWASSVEFGDSTSSELDFYAGFAGDIANSIFSYDVGVIYYFYPGDPANSGQNFWEFGGSLSADLGMAGISIGAWFSPDFYANSGDSLHVPIDIEIPIPLGNSDDFGLAFSGGVAWNEFFDLGPGADYVNWHLGLTLSITDIADIDLRYHDTDVSACNNVCDERFVVTVSRGF
ncbi:MAG: TorF family putative porin [Alphaproteobacteria bacterium]|nr:TorF family putative porin [Alphaproteobacteria bacterium]